MKIRRLRQSILFLVLVGWLAGCADHLIPTVAPGSTTSRLRVKSITETLPNSQSYVSAFRYDAQGRLSQILAFQTPDSTTKDYEVNTYQYDAQNRITQLQRRLVSRIPGSVPTNFERYEFTYNAAGQVSDARYFIGNLLGFSTPIRYNAANKLSRATTIYATSGLTSTQQNDYTYTGDNITTTTTIFTFNRTFPVVSTRIVLLTYDDRVNPFYGLSVIPAPFGPAQPNPITSAPSLRYTYFGGLNNIFNLSVNNVLSDGLGNSYAYTYNAANLPLTRATTNGGNVTETLRFEYEAY